MAKKKYPATCLPELKGLEWESRSLHSEVRLDGYDRDQMLSHVEHRDVICVTSHGSSGGHYSKSELPMSDSRPTMKQNFSEVAVDVSV
jgi:hypothetical protein